MYCLKTLPPKLGTGNAGPVGIKHSPGVQHRFYGSTHPGNSPKSGHFLRLRAESHSGGDAPKGGNHRAVTDRGCTGFLLKPVPCPQERWGHETGNKLETAEQVYPSPPLQDGGNAYPEGSVEEGQLVDKGGPEGCVFHHPNPQEGQAVPQVLSPGSSLSIHMPAVRPLVRSLGLYQDPEASTNPAQRAGGEASGIYRRYPGDGGDRATGKRPHPGPDPSSGKPGLHCPSRENGPNSISGNRVPGSTSQFQDHGVATPRSKDKEATPRNNKAPENRDSPFGKGSVTPAGETEFSGPGNSSGAIVLQNTADGPDQSPRLRKSVLRDPLPTLRASKDRNELVDRPASPVEWQEHGSGKPRPLHRIGCIPNRVRSILPGSPHRRSLVTGGETAPHQLPRASGSLPGSKNIHEGPEAKASPASAGQHYCCSLYQQSGGNSLCPGNHNCQGALDVVPRERDYSVCPTLTREGQHYSRPRVEGDERPLRLDVEPGCLPQDCRSFSQPQCRSICFSPDIPAPTFLQLETGPDGRGNRCLYSGLEHGVRLCQPPMEPDREGTVQSGGTRGGGGACSTHMALAAMVPQTSQSASLHTTQDYASGKPNDRSSGGLSIRNQAPSSHVAYLRQHYENQKLSKEASDLLLSSWWQKSSQSYDSLCKKWISWCSERTW